MTDSAFAICSEKMSSIAERAARTAIVRAVDGIEAAARSDAEFDGQVWEGMSRTARARYIARASRAIAAYEEARGA